MVKSSTFLDFDPSVVPSPCFVVDEAALEKNLQILQQIQDASGAKILLALKAFSLFGFASLIRKYLSGTCASGLHEARLGYEEFGGEVHTFSAAYTEQDLKTILTISDHVVFNSFAQWQRFQPLIKEARQMRPQLNFGLRINPLHSENGHELYDPCIPGSRLGIPKAAFDNQSIQGISGLHFHTLCEQNFPPLARTLDAVEHQFGEIIHQMQWVNFGGGHLVTQAGYQIDQLIKRIQEFSDRYKVQVYLEPGEAVVINTGVLVSEVLDISCNGMNVAILDTSAACHMPDILEMPYRAEIFGSGTAHEKVYTYRLGGQTCLAGDVMGDYSFDQPLHVGQRLIFDDMSHYTMVKTNTFNGLNLPAIAIWNSEIDQVRVMKQFGYDEFKNRLT